MENGLFKVHSFLNGFERNNKDPTCILGKRYINAIIAISGIL